MTRLHYFFKEIEGRYLIFSRLGVLDENLSRYAKFLSRTAAKNTVRSYLRNVIMWVNHWNSLQSSEGWLAEPEDVRKILFDFLVEKFNCKLRRVRKREGYVIFEKDWIPKTIDSSDFHKVIWAGGQQVGWRLREKIVYRMLFETGGRISEVLGITLADWVKHGCGDAASIFSKGSEGARVKTLVWSPHTTRLLRQYFDTERLALDKNKFTLIEYQHRYDSDLFKATPLFINKFGIALTPNAYRSLYWNPACKSIMVAARIHQARHWFVTSHIRKIFEDFSSDNVLDEKIESQTEALISYMSWRAGRYTLKSYNHFFMKDRIAGMLDSLHKSLDFENYSISEKSVGELQKNVMRIQSLLNSKVNKNE
jgi:site-specific recombinase XerD